MDLAMSTPAAFWDGVARKYAAQPIKRPDLYAHTLDRVRRRLRADDRVLELGCGTGSTALTLAPNVADYLATDVSPEMIAIGREKAAQATDTPPRFAVAAVEDAPTRDGGYDAVLGFNVAHLLDDPAAAFRHIRGLLRPGGLLITKTPCLGRASALRGLIWILRQLGKAPHVACFRGDALDKALRDAGFALLETDDYKPGLLKSRYVVAQRIDYDVAKRAAERSIDMRWMTRFDPAIPFISA